MALQLQALQQQQRRHATPPTHATHHGIASLVLIWSQARGGSRMVSLGMLSMVTTPSCSKYCTDLPRVARMASRSLYYARAPAPRGRPDER